MQKKAYRFYSTFFPCAESMRAIPSAQDERILPIRTFAQSVHRIPIYIAHGHCQWSNKSMYAISSHGALELVWNVRNYCIDRHTPCDS